MIKTHIEEVEMTGQFFKELSNQSILFAINSMLNDEVLQTMEVVEFTQKSDGKTIVKFAKRLFPLTLEQVQEKYRN